jgi:hypothetical protein
VHVGGAAGVSGKESEAHVGAVVVDIEIADVTGYHHLVGLLEILAGGKAVTDLGGQRIESHPFQMIGVLDIPCDGKDGFEGVHHLHCSA